MSNRTRSRRIQRHARRLLNGVGGFGVEALYVSRTVLREYHRQRALYARWIDSLVAARDERLGY